MAKTIYKHQITDSLQIIEKLDIKEQVFEYYIGKDFIFGVEKRFNTEELKALYQSGYFKPWTE